MFDKLIPLFLILLVISACGGHTSKRGYSTNPGKESSITFDISSDSATQSNFVFTDTVTLRMDSTGKIGWLTERIKMLDLQQKVQDSLISIYLHTGKLPSRLQVQYLGTVTMGIRGTADDMIRQAQEVVKNVIAVKTLNLPFGRLDSARQAKFQKKYPVLFQKYY